MMFTIQEYAGLAYYVYRDMPTILKYIPRLVYQNRLYSRDNFLKSIKKYDGIYQVDVDPSIQAYEESSNDFYGSVFVKVKNHLPTSVCVSIRGTVPEKVDNDLADIKSWWKTVFDENARVNLPSYYVNLALKLYQHARQFALNHLNLTSDKIFVVGHSLGGAVAGLLLAYCRVPSFAITFNAPGIKEVPKVQNVWDRIINIRSQYDFVSAIGEAIGPVWNVPVPEFQTEAKHVFDIAMDHELNKLDYLTLNELTETEDFLISVGAQHKMLNLWKALTKQSIVHDTYANFESYLKTLQQAYQIRLQQVT